MTTTTEKTTDFRAHLTALDLNSSPERQAALARFEELGIPTIKNEEWKYANLRPLAETVFQPRATVKLSLSEFQELAPTPENGTRLVFVNGRYAAELCRTACLPANVAVKSLTDVAPSELGAVIQLDLTPFTALNAALWEDGAYVRIAKGAVVEEPIQLIFISRGTAEPQSVHSRILIVAEAGSQARVVETYVGEGTAFNNVVVEISVGENAILEHTKVQEESETSFHIAATQVKQAASSTFTSNNVGFGARIARNDVNVMVAGEHCETWLNGAYTVFGEQLVDNHTRIDHAVPNCHSFEVYKGILGDQGIGVFNGKIYVYEDAQKTDAKQTNKALLLSRTATMNTKPQLEIFADDVKCTHGATVGQLDEDQLFYLRSRGLPLVEAKTLLTYAFVSEVLEKVSIEPLRDALELKLMDRVRSAQPNEGEIQ
jgi:Fe-S cluster assembly protein SufD